MNIAELIENFMVVIDKARVALQPLPSIMLLCTCMRRPGISAVVTSAKIMGDMEQNENDDVVKKFIFNVVEKIKLNFQDDAVCFIAIPPGELRFKLMSANGGGPIVLDGTNNSYVFMWAIIR